MKIDGFIDRDGHLDGAKKRRRESEPANQPREIASQLRQGEEIGSFLPHKYDRCFFLVHHS